MYFRYLLYALLIYLLYRLVFHFIIPVYKTTRQVKKQFRDMHSRMQDHMNQQSAYAEASADKQAGNSKNSAPKTDSNKEKAGDYIDFEEVK